jgi:hypothetical protein
MSEVVSFGNIVNSLRLVREDYNEHLKSVPQYEAFLLFESSTEKVAGTLQGITDTAQPASMAGEVIAALVTAKAKFKEHLVSVPEYRALMAIDKLISDVSADLGVKSEVQPAPQAEAEQVSTTTSQADPVAQASSDQTAVAEQAAVTEQAAVAEQAPLEIAVAEQIPVQQEVSEQPSTSQEQDAVPLADAVAELPTVELTRDEPPAMPEPAVAEQAPEPLIEVSQPAVAVHVAGQPTELTAHAPTEESSPFVPQETVEPFEPAAEKAA